MSAASDFRGAYSPGGHVVDPAEQRLRRHRAAIQGGLASGRRRRQLAHRRRGHVDGQLRAPLRYELRAAGRLEFNQLYEQAFPCPEQPGAAARWQTRREALWLYQLGVWRLLCARGQHCGTTNGRRQVALANVGAGRCRRTVQTYNRLLAELGIATVSHVKRGGAAAGNRDFLRIEWRLHRASQPRRRRRAEHTFDLAPSLRERGTRPSAGSSPPHVNVNDLLSPPASPAREAPPDKPAGTAGTETGWIRARIKFLDALSRGAHVTETAARQRQDEIRALLAQLGDGSGQDTSRIDSTTSEGLRWSQ